MHDSYYTEAGDNDEQSANHRQGMLDFFAQAQNEFDIQHHDSVMDRALNEASYTMGELGLWTDQEGGISVDAILQAWALVETLKKNGARFPQKLKM